MNINALTYAVGAILLGAVGIVFHDFAMQWQPVPAGIGMRTQLAYLAGAVLAAGGAMLLAPRLERAGALLLAGFIGLWMLVVGFGSGAMTLYFQITIAEASRPEERGAALALGGMGWSLSHLSTPLLMGFLADRYGIVEAFYVLGGLALACAVLIAWMRQWAFQGRPSVRPA